MTEITIIHFLILSAMVFIIGVAGILLNRTNILIILMSIELMLLSSNINLVAFSSHFGNITGQVFGVIVLTIAAAETAIGLAILVVYFKNRRSITVEDANELRW